MLKHFFPFCSNNFDIDVMTFAGSRCRLTSAVGTQIRPLRYILTDSGFISNVRYLSPVGDGWLSAAGDYVVRDDRTVEILFDSFWWDIGRDNLQPDPKGKVSFSPPTSFLLHSSSANILSIDFTQEFCWKDLFH